MALVVVGGAIAGTMALLHPGEPARGTEATAGSEAPDRAEFAALAGDVTATITAAGGAPRAGELARTLVGATLSGGAAGTTALTGALDDFRAEIAAQTDRTLADYSDAAHTTEAALVSARDTVATAETADLPDAVSAWRAARDAVIDDAKAFRADLIADSAATNTQPTGGDVDTQLDYLMTYVFDYNSDTWGDYNPYGGDCTNFASQGLLARGWKIDDRWYSHGRMWTASKPWIATAAMASYFDSLGLSFSTQDDLDRVRVGDIGLFDWGETGVGYDHTMTVSKVEYTADGPVVSFVSHNHDGKYRELREALYTEHTDSTVRIYHIP